MTRWDSPLFTVPYDDEKPPCDEIWNAMVGSEGKGKIVKPNLATVAVGESLPASYLQPSQHNSLETSDRTRLSV